MFENTTKIKNLEKIIAQLKSENKELKSENETLKANQDATVKAMDEFKNLSKQLRELQELYKNKIREIDIMKKDYEIELKSIVATAKKEINK